MFGNQGHIMAQNNRSFQIQSVQIFHMEVVHKKVNPSKCVKFIWVKAFVAGLNTHLIGIKSLQE